VRVKKKIKAQQGKCTQKKKIWHSRVLVSEKQDNTTLDAHKKNFRAQQGTLSAREKNYRKAQQGRLSAHENILQQGT